MEKENQLYVYPIQQTTELDEKYRLYYRKAEDKKEIKQLGLSRDKKIKYFGTVETIVILSITKDENIVEQAVDKISLNSFETIVFDKRIDYDIKSRIREAINAANNIIGYDNKEPEYLRSYPNVFYMFDNFSFLIIVMNYQLIIILQKISTPCVEKMFLI